MNRLEIDILDPDRRLSADQLAWLRRHARLAAELLRLSGEIRARIVADAEMAALHERYSGVPGTTDVLTFDLAAHPSRPTIALDTTGQVVVDAPSDIDADLCICFDEAARQGTTRGHPLEFELLLYLIHGALHCLGFDDLSPAQADVMHGLEDAVLRSIGVGPVFRGGS